MRAGSSAIRRALLEAFRAKPDVAVSWRPERVDRDLAEFGDANSYAGLVAPEDFLGVTSMPGRIKDIVDIESFPLNLDRVSNLNNEYMPSLPRETPFLGVAKVKGRDINTTHEGRHRTTAFGNEGARKVPILIHPAGFFVDTINRTWRPPKRGSLKLSPDRFYGSWPAEVSDIIPLKPENREALINLGKRPGVSRHITYLLPILAALLAQTEAEEA